MITTELGHTGCVIAGHSAVCSHVGDGTDSLRYDCTTCGVFEVTGQLELEFNSTAHDQPRDDLAYYLYRHRGEAPIRLTTSNWRGFAAEGARLQREA